MNRKREVNTDAVSPVIGVMLMIVVTIIIAAVVSAFAGGFAEGQQKTPTAQIDVQMIEAQDSGGDWYPRLIFTHKGGDSIPTKDIRIITYNGDGAKHVTDGSLAPGGANAFDAEEWSAGTGSGISNDGYPCKVTNGACTAANEFGNLTWGNGDILSTTDDDSTLTVLGSSEILYRGKTILVDIVYIPSNELIFHKEVMAS